ncbi:hypothetical protein P692DRAFT_20710981, partial [Suillus brevipes Sb2]
MKAWSVFALAHFKPFSTLRQLFGEHESAIEAFQAYDFSPRSRKVMQNWDSIHECEDERDADRLRKQTQLAAESKALTSSLAVGSLDDDIEFDLSRALSRRSEQDFRIQQVVLLMQQSRWLRRREKCLISESDRGISVPDDLAKSNIDTDVLPQAEKIVLYIKTWKDEIKKQEDVIADSRRNALNP